MSLRIAALLVLLLGATGAQAQYKWVDTDGRTSYGDQPPRDARQVERIDAPAVLPAGGDEFVGLPFEIRRIARDFPVTLYTTVGASCTPCSDARAFLKGRSVPFVERTVSTNKDLAAYEALGGNTRLPAVSIGRNWLRGFEAVSWGEALEHAGYSAGLELPRAWQWPTPSPLTRPDPAPAPAPAAGVQDGAPAAAGNN
jgi:glutaredoxin